MNASPPDNAMVYVVDDDASVRRALVRMFKARGWRATACSTAKAFLEEANGDTVGCLVLDVQMPGLSGLELQELLNSHRVDIPIVFMSAHGDIPMSVKAVKAGAVDFLPKPVDSDQLFEVVCGAVERHVAESEARATVQTFRTRLEKLTAREREVMGLVVEGLLNKQIADQLGITLDTVKVHRGRVMRKTGVASVAELVRLCERAGVLSS